LKLDRATSTSFLNINNQGVDGLPAVVTDVPPTSYVIDQINLRGYGHVTFVDTDDTITIQMSNMLGDGTSQVFIYLILYVTRSSVEMESSMLQL
jgi:hypothetical protein